MHSLCLKIPIFWEFLGQNWNFLKCCTLCTSYRYIPVCNICSAASVQWAMCWVMCMCSVIAVFTVRCIMFALVECHGWNAVIVVNCWTDLGLLF